MEASSNLIEVLNALIKTNNDRIEGYEHAIKESGDKDIDLKAVFSKMVEESKQYIDELAQRVTSISGEAVSHGTSVPGRLHRTWMDIKTSLGGSSRLALLESCEFGEDATQKAYQHALESEEHLDGETRELIAKQQEALKRSHDTIKKFRDMHRKAGSDDIVSADSLRASDNDLRSEKYLNEMNH